jgi:toxin ParE1/3/4
MSRKRAEYRLTPAAIEDLDNIWLYTFEEWGVQQAHRYTDDITAAFSRLAMDPKIGAPCDYVREGYRRCLVGQHAIYFQVTEYGIAVIRVLHTRMDAPRHI